MGASMKLFRLFIILSGIVVGVLALLCLREDPGNIAIASVVWLAGVFAGLGLAPKGGLL
jgi:hypothetical protein